MGTGVRASYIASFPCSLQGLSVGPGRGESLRTRLCHVHVWFSAQLDPKMCSPLSLEQLSLLCIVGELEHLTIAVAVLPSHLYHNLLSSLPVADVCHLENTRVAEAIDFESIWKEVG